MKHSYLDSPTKPIVVREKTIGELVGEMRNTGFQGRSLGESVDIWKMMLEEEGLSVFMGLSGAMVPAGMRKIIAYFIQNRMIDCLVTTGANIFHDVHEALGGHHYRGSDDLDDSKLFECEIDRIHDVLAPEGEFRTLDMRIAEFVESLDRERRYSSREFMYILGKEIADLDGDRDSILVSAYKANIPVYIPALSDSSIGIGLTVARRNGFPVHVDHIKDVDEITSIVEASEKTGVVYVGGGVPKNFIQQTEVVASIHKHESTGHEYAIQYTTDSPQFGGLSGCTFDEAVSWGKISTTAKNVQVFVDATIALPLVSHALMEKTKTTIENRTFPKFNVSKEDIQMSF